jgi:hypothetical protein
MPTTTPDIAGQTTSARRVPPNIEIYPSCYAVRVEGLRSAGPSTPARLPASFSPGITDESHRLINTLINWLFEFDDRSFSDLDDLLRPSITEDADIAVSPPSQGEVVGTRRLRILSRATRQPDIVGLEEDLAPGEEPAQDA